MVKHTQRIRRLKSGPILESKGMGVIFQKNGKIFENLGKNVQKLRIFWKWAGECVR